MSKPIKIMVVVVVFVVFFCSNTLVPKMFGKKNLGQNKLLDLTLRSISGLILGSIFGLPLGPILGSILGLNIWSGIVFNIGVQYCDQYLGSIL